MSPAAAPGRVQFALLGDVGEFIRGNGLQKSDLTDTGAPAIHYGQIHTFYGVWTDSTKSFTSPELAARLRRARPGDLIIATTSEDDAAVAKATAWVGDGEVAISGDAYIYRHQLDPRYVAYFFRSEQFQRQKLTHITGTKVRRVSGDSLATIRIPVPILEVQHRIARILDRFTDLEAQLEAELEAELEARRIQFEFYRNHLLTLAKEEESTRRMTIGDLLSLRSGSFVAASDISHQEDDAHPYPCYGGNGLRGYVGEPNREGDRILVGRQGAWSGNVKRVSGRFYATEHAVVVTPKEPVSTSWLFHELTAMNLNQYVSNGAQPGLAVGNLNKLLISVPDLDEQSRVGQILDKFESAVNDLSIGLPAELIARRKQYEYYRDKLFTFDEAPA